jgi:uncharacterized protein YjbJ (UPF0337 family)
VTDNGDKVKGTAKEAVGKLTGSDELAKEGQAQQDKAEHREEAEKAEQREKSHQGS